MSVAAPVVWEVRSGGADDNGGGFVPGASGTDYSQQDSAQVTYTDLMMDNTDHMKVTSSAHPFTSAHVGNVINITGGSGWYPGRYSIVSVSSNVATLNDYPANSASPGTGKLGGAIATLGLAVTLCNQGGMTCYVKGATYQITASLDPSSTAGAGLARFIGYNSTRGDGGRATIQINANNVTMATWGSGNDWSGISWENFVFDGNSKTGSKGFDFASNRCGFNFYNCLFENFTGSCCKVIETAVSLYNCEFANNNFASGLSSCLSVPDDEIGGAYFVHRCYFHGNGPSNYPCIDANLGRISVTNSIFYDNTTTCIGYWGVGVIRNNVFHSNDAGISVGEDSSLFSGLIENNIFTDNEYAIGGIIFENEGAIPTICNNAYYGNTNDDYVFTDTDPITLTGSPYVSAPTDFSLNSTAGAGLACQAAGMPGTIGLTSVVATGYPDVGAVQLDASPSPSPAPAPVTTAYTFAS